MARHLLLSFGVLVFLGTPCLVPAELNPVLTARVALVFPFQVGQRYEFQSARTFPRPNGVILPAYTIDTVTVTDTTINGKTWLHLPYWSSFGTEYYRLDDSLRVWNINAANSEERILLDLGYSGWRRGLGGPVDCPNTECFDVMQTGSSTERPSPRIEQPFHVAYHPNDEKNFNDAYSVRVSHFFEHRKAGEPIFLRISYLSCNDATVRNSNLWAFQCSSREIIGTPGDGFIRYIAIRIYDIRRLIQNTYRKVRNSNSGWTIAKGMATGWEVVDGDSALGYSYHTCCPTIGLGELHGESGPGTVQHRKYEFTDTWFIIRLYGYFRPMSAERWPPPFGEPVAIREEEPARFELALSAHPNPFNGSATIRFALSRKSMVTLAVYASTGQLVRRLAGGDFGAGTREVVWDGLNEHGDPVASGVYIVRLTTPAQTATHRVTMIR